VKEAENFTELGNNEHHQHAHDGHSHHHDGDGIEHGGNHFAFDLLRFLHELRQADEHHFQHAAQLAGFDHVDEEAVENLGVLGQGLGEGAAPFDGRAQIAQDVLEIGAFFLLLQDAQSAQEGQSGLHQSGQLAREGGQHLGLDPPAQAGNVDLEIEGAAAFLVTFFAGLFGAGVSRLAAAAFVFDDLGGEEAHVADATDGLVLAADFEGAFGFLAPGVHGHIIVLWHKIRCI
jgi:hypothetical protein